MGQLALRFEKPNLGADLKLGVVARVRQIKDADGNFPADPEGRDVVIPAGTSTMRTIENLPLGTYRIEARLPSGQVLRETREVKDEQQPVEVVFDAGNSPHEWLSWQRLAGNVPSQSEYEIWIKNLTDQINRFAEAKAEAAKPIQVDPTTVRMLARFLHSAHVKLQPVLTSLGRQVGKAITGISDAVTFGDGVSQQPRPASPAAVPEPPEFELLQADPNGEHLWDVVGSMSTWREWRAAAQQDDSLAIERINDRQLTLWRITQLDRASRVAGPFGRSIMMRSVAAMRRGDGIDVIPLPVPWPLSMDFPAATLEILREAGTSESGRSTLTVRDEFVGSLLIYLNSGQMSDAATVLGEANEGGMIEQLISEKLNNPFAACAAAYVGLATLSGEGAPPQWTGWLDNLMNFFEWLPDGAIIRASYRLKTAQTQEDLDTALASFKTGYQRGIPFYTAGLQHLMNGLYTFSGKDPGAKTMNAKVSAVASRANRDRAFTQVTIAK